MNVSKMIKAFVASDEFVSAVVSSTNAGFGGSGYSVEFFPDGHWRVLWDNQIGNLYVSPGMILGIPQLDGSQLEEVDDENGETMGEVIKFYRDDFLSEMLDAASFAEDGGIGR